MSTPGLEQPGEVDRHGPKRRRGRELFERVLDGLRRRLGWVRQPGLTNCDWWRGDGLRQPGLTNGRCWLGRRGFVFVELDVLGLDVLVVLVVLGLVLLLGWR